MPVHVYLNAINWSSPTNYEQVGRLSWSELKISGFLQESTTIFNVLSLQVDLTGILHKSS